MWVLANQSTTGVDVHVCLQLFPAIASDRSVFTSLKGSYSSHKDGTLYFLRTWNVHGWYKCLRRTFCVLKVGRTHSDIFSLWPLTLFFYDLSPFMIVKAIPTQLWVVDWKAMEGDTSSTTAYVLTTRNNTRRRHFSIDVQLCEFPAMCFELFLVASRHQISLTS